MLLMSGISWNVGDAGPLSMPVPLAVSMRASPSGRYAASVRKVAETRVAVSRALIPRSMPCMKRWRAAPESTSTERRGSTATSSPGSAPAT